MIWKDELAKIDELTKRLQNLGADVSRTLTQSESRMATLTNEIAKLEGDYRVLEIRNELARKDFQKSMRLDLEQLEEGKRRVQARELALMEKEKEIQKLKAELEASLATAKASRQTVEALGRNHGKK